MFVNPEATKNILINKLSKYRSLKLPAGTPVKMHESMLTLAIDTIYVLSEQVHDLNKRLDALQKENTNLSLYGFHRNESGTMERIHTEVRDSIGKSN
jgi:hypothetical protein